MHLANDIIVNDCTGQPRLCHRRELNTGANRDEPPSVPAVGSPNWVDELVVLKSI